MKSSLEKLEYSQNKILVTETLNYEAGLAFKATFGMAGDISRETGAKALINKIGLKWIYSKREKFRRMQIKFIEWSFNKFEKYILLKDIIKIETIIISKYFGVTVKELEYTI